MGLLWGCVAKVDFLPPTVIPYDSMAAFLADVHRLEVMIQTHSWHADSARYRAMPIYYQIMQRHGIDPTRFRQSWDYYLTHPHHMDSVYVRVIQRLRAQIPSSNLP